MDVKGKVLLQLFNKSKLRNGTKTYLEQNFFSIVKFKKLGFSAPLNIIKSQFDSQTYYFLIKFGVKTYYLHHVALIFLSLNVINITYVF